MGEYTSISLSPWLLNIFLTRLLLPYATHVVHLVAVVDSTHIGVSYHLLQRLAQENTTSQTADILVAPLDMVTVDQEQDFNKPNS